MVLIGSTLLWLSIAVSTVAPSPVQNGQSVFSLMRQYSDQNNNNNNYQDGNEARMPKVGNCTTEGCVTVAGYVLANLDQDANPCRDFYAYACGKFVANTWLNELTPMPMPVRVHDSYNQRIEIIVDEVLRQRRKRGDLHHGSDDDDNIRFPVVDDTRIGADQKAADFFAGCTAAKAVIDEAGSLRFVRDLIRDVGGFYVSQTRATDLKRQFGSKWSVEDAMVRALPYLMSMGLFSLAISRDDYNSSRYSVVLLPADTAVTLLVEHPFSMNMLKLRQRRTHHLRQQPLSMTKHWRLKTKSVARSFAFVQPQDIYRRAFLGLLRRFALIVAPSPMSASRIDEYALQALADFEDEMSILVRNATTNSMHGSTFLPNAISKINSLTDMYRLCPFIDWAKVTTLLGQVYGVDALTRAGSENFKNLALYTTSRTYLSGLCRLVRTTMGRRQGDGPAIIQSYLSFQALIPYFVNLADNFRIPFEDFTNQVLSGQMMHGNGGQEPPGPPGHMGMPPGPPGSDVGGGPFGRVEISRRKRQQFDQQQQQQMPSFGHGPSMFQGDDLIRCREMSKSLFAIVISRRYIESHFSRQTKREATRLAEAIRQELLANFENENLMDARTKENAKRKAESILIQIGYPETLFGQDLGTWVDTFLSDLNITSYDHLTNLVNVARFIVKRELNRLDKIPDRNEWGMQAYENNAEYDFNENAVHVTAAAANEPFFRPDFPDAWNFGALGYTVGHEFTHSVDSSGALYDETGQIVGDWWTNATKREFQRRSQCMLEQYCNMSSPIPGVYVNGQQTLDENIADNGGLKLAYKAFKKRIGASLKQPALPGSTLTNEQLFFVSVAQGYCEVISKGMLTEQLLLDEHPPNNLRVQGMMMNSEAWSAAFNCPVQTPMNPRKKCQVW